MNRVIQKSSIYRNIQLKTTQLDNDEKRASSMPRHQLYSFKQLGTGLKEASRKPDAAGGTLERFPSCDYPGTTQAYSLTDSLL